MRLTDLEVKGIVGIMESQYNSESPTDSMPIWSWDIPTLTESQRPGVCSSLVKKGLAKSNGIPQEREIWLTEKGVDVYRAIKFFEKAD